MENRCMPSITVPTAGQPGPVVINGDQGPDDFVIRLQAGDSTKIQVSDDDGHSFTTVALADVTSISVNGNGGRDSLTIDNSNGLVAESAHSAFQVTNLVSDQAGVAPITDPNLVNGWGIALNPSGAFWVSSNGADLSTIYTGDTGSTPLAKSSLTVNIPNGEPTGQVYNGTSDFQITSGSNTAPATFLFASESGTVSGWNAGVPTPSPSHNAQVGFTATDGAIYKGIALANNGTANHLYLADFHNDKIDVLDGSFNKVNLSGSFTDPNLPAGYAPFNVAAINNQLYVTYAKQDATAHDDVAGAGNGLIDVFDLNGNFVKRLVTGGELNSPWGMVAPPAIFGSFSNDLLVGNFGDGHINAYNSTTGAFVGELRQANGQPITIDGLWGLSFGNGAAGSTTSLYFSAGPSGEAHGLFGKITVDNSVTVGLPITFDGGNGRADLIVTGNGGANVTEDFSASGDRTGTLTLTNGAITTTISMVNVSQVTDTTNALTLNIHVNDTTRIVDILKGKPVNGIKTIVVKGPQAEDLNDNVNDRRDTVGEDSDEDVEDNDGLHLSDFEDNLRNSRGMMPITFANKTNVNITATGGDHQFVINAKQAAQGLQNLTIDGGPGFNVAVTANLPAGVNVTLLNIDRRDSDDDSSFIDDLYAQRLERLPDDNELSFWRGFVSRFGRSAATAGIEQSEEARNNLVLSWYIHYLGRVAVGGEHQYWVNLLLNGQTEEQTLSGIIASDEFFARAQNLFHTGNANQNLIVAAYSLILNRTADSGEIGFWLGYVAQNGRAAMALGFLTSFEFRSLMSSVFYNVFLDRTPDSDETNYWAGGSGDDLNHMRQGFEGSDEFFNNEGD